MIVLLLLPFMPRSLSEIERPWSKGWGLIAGLLLAVLVMVSVEGCRCRAETPAEQAAREAAEEQERLEEEQRRLEEELQRAAIVLPPPVMLPGTFGAPSLFAKPGHWSAVTQPAKANAENFDGTLSLELVNAKSTPINLPQTAFHLTSRRPMVVAQESAKDIDSMVFVPPVGGAKSLRPAVRNRRTGALESRISVPLRPLLDHQYHFVVLAKEPAQYGFLDSLYAVTSPLPTRVDTAASRESSETLEPDKNYRLVALPAGDGSRGTPLPDDPFAWTSIAYLLWDEVDPDSLRPGQRDALVDWINWGGQVIINGPDSLDLLQGSFLEPLLPATSSGTIEISSTQLEQFESTWGVDPSSSKNKLAGENPWTGIGLRLATDARSLPGLDGLLVERRIGRGRVVVSAFQLARRELINWSSGVENFFNAAVLRRPPRKFLASDYEDDRPTASWLVGKADSSRLRADPFINSGLRLFARDSRSLKERDQLPLRLVQVSQDDGEFLELKPPTVRGGVIAWNDEAPVPVAARDTLRQSAGVSVPGSGFVIGCLAVYLLVLVPANWGFFYAIGRVELAWVAAPLIAIVGAAGVIRQAQLDIGFVRARTEVAVLEIQPETPRAVLSRFTSLYTSLSTTYDFEFDQQAVAAPFARLVKENRNQDLITSKQVYFERQDRTRLLGMGVSSNASEYVRSEETVDISMAVPDGSSRVGAIRIGDSRTGSPRLENTTAWDLAEVAIVRRADGTGGDAWLEGCWIGDLPAGGTASVVYTSLPPQDEEALFAQERREAKRLRDFPRAGWLDMERLFKIALDPERFEPGERRVVGQIDGILPGLTITPDSSQRHGATMVVVHLGYGPMAAPRSDVNTPGSVR